MATYLSPTDVAFYDGHPTVLLESLLERIAREGGYIAANSGADHPIAREYAAMAAAVIGQLAMRDVNRAGLD